MGLSVVHVPGGATKKSELKKKKKKTCLEVGVPQVGADKARPLAEAPKHVCSLQVGLVKDGAAEDALVELFAGEVLAGEVLEGGLLELACVFFVFFM